MGFEKVGDCEDICFEKRKKLIDRGFDEGAIRLVLCYTERREAHAVLAIELTNGTWIMDNRKSRILPYNLFPYQWIAREKPGHYFWERVSNDRPQV